LHFHAEKKLNERANESSHLRICVILTDVNVFRNLRIKFRHIGSFPDGSSPIGCSLFTAVQNYVCQSDEGIPKAVRGNADVFAIWRTGNAKKLDLLMTELSGMIRKEKLSKAYNTVMNKDPIDRHASRG
jgi:hypothetical protein